MKYRAAWIRPGRQTLEIRGALLERGRRARWGGGLGYAKMWRRWSALGSRIQLAIISTER